MWLKVRHKIFFLYLRKVVKYIWYKDIQMECMEPFYKKVPCLHEVIFISQHFDWVLCIIFGMWFDEQFSKSWHHNRSKKFEQEAVKTATKCCHILWVIKVNKRWEITSVYCILYLCNKISVRKPLVNISHIWNFDSHSMIPINKI